MTNESNPAREALTRLIKNYETITDCAVEQGAVSNDDYDEYLDITNHTDIIFDALQHESPPNKKDPI